MFSEVLGIGNLKGLGAVFGELKMRFLIPRTSLSFENMIFVLVYGVQTINITLACTYLQPQHELLYINVAVL